MLALFTGACSRDFVEVTYPQMISPSENYTELKKLAIGIDPKMNPELKALVTQTLKKCSLFGEVVTMDKPVRVSGSNPKDYFDALIKRSDLAQASQGILSLQYEDASQSDQLEKGQAILVEDQEDEDWYPAVGMPIAGSLGFQPQPEIAPVVKLKRRDVFIRTDKSQYILRLVLYNRVSGKIVHDRVIVNQSSLHNYSRKPSIQKERFAKIVERTVVEEALFHICPTKASVARKIYNTHKKDPAGRQIDEGVSLAQEDRWNLAATKWSNVLIKDPKNSFAHHNLGVHLEKQGEFFKALEQFRLAKLNPPFGDNVYDSIQAQYLPKVEGTAFYPQIAFVTGGSWAYVRSDGKILPEIKRISLYRLENIVNPENSRVTGLALREVGLIRTWAGKGPYFPARIREFLLEYPVKTGDLLLLE